MAASPVYIRHDEINAGNDCDQIRDHKSPADERYHLQMRE
jgi:hypothetical protein